MSNFHKVMSARVSLLGVSALALSIAHADFAQAQSFSFNPNDIVVSVEGDGSNTGGNYAISGEYGASSEGTLQVSGNGQYLTIMGYGINADSYNSTYDVNGSGTALAPNHLANGIVSVSAGS